MAPLTLSCDLHFRGLDRPVRFLNCVGLDAEIAAIFPSWEFEVAAADHPEPAATVAQAGSRFRVTSPFTDAPKFYDTAVNALCDLVALLPMVQADASPDTLWLHAAAVDIAGRAVLLPAVRRSGKTLLSVALAARGTAVLGDDVVGVMAREGTGPDILASGIAPRLRLPLPDGIDPAIGAFATEHAGPDNGQYRYLRLPHVPARGTAMPAGAVVLLDRQDSGPVTLTPASRGEVLRRLLHQHFTRDRDSSVVMAALFELASATQAWTLRYAEPGAAADALLRRGADLFPDALPRPIAVQPAPGQSEPAPFDGRRYERAPAADLRTLDGTVFAVAADGSRIVALDEGAQRLWALLAEPATLAEAVTILAAAFPEADAETIRTDTERTFRQFHALGLIR